MKRKQDYKNDAEITISAFERWMLIGILVFVAALLVEASGLSRAGNLNPLFSLCLTFGFLLLWFFLLQMSAKRRARRSELRWAMRARRAAQLRRRAAVQQARGAREFHSALETFSRRTPAQARDADPPHREFWMASDIRLRRRVALRPLDRLRFLLQRIRAIVG